MHHIYQTDCFVLKGTPSGEESKSILLLTRDLGVLFARAQGVRRAASKLRFALADFSYSKVSLVRGKEIWRIVNAVPENSVYAELADKQHAQRLAAKIFSLIARMVSGEEPHPELFDYIRGVIADLSSADFSEDEIKVAEPIIILRILAFLGYATPDEGLSQFTEGKIDHATLALAAPFMKKMISEINESLSASQL